MKSVVQHSTLSLLNVCKILLLRNKENGVTLIYALISGTQIEKFYIALLQNGIAV